MGNRVRWVFREERVILGILLKDARLDRKLSQESVANLLGKEHSYLSRVESAQSFLDVIALVDLLDMMEVDPCDFFREFAERCKISK